MGKERVKVWLRTKVQKLWVVRMVYMCEDAKKLAVDVFDG